MSGFSAAPTIETLDEPYTAFLHKPFVADALLAALRSVMPPPRR